MKYFAVGNHVAGWGHAWDSVTFVWTEPPLILGTEWLEHFWWDGMHPAPVVVLELKLRQLNFGCSAALRNKPIASDNTWAATCSQ